MTTTANHQLLLKRYDLYKQCSQTERRYPELSMKNRSLPSDLSYVEDKFDQLWRDYLDTERRLIDNCSHQIRWLLASDSEARETLLPQAEVLPVSIAFLIKARVIVNWLEEEGPFMQGGAWMSEPEPWKDKGQWPKSKGNWYIFDGLKFAYTVHSRKELTAHFFERVMAIASLSREELQAHPYYRELLE